MSYYEHEVRKRMFQLLFAVAQLMLEDTDTSHKNIAEDIHGVSRATVSDYLLLACKQGYMKRVKTGRFSQYDITDKGWDLLEEDIKKILAHKPEQVN